MTALICITIWLSSGFVAAGFSSAYLFYDMHKNPYSDMPITAAIMFMIGGPSALLGVIYCGHYKHGWRKWW